MRVKDRPFAVYRKGPGSFTIVPRGAKGWFQIGVWAALGAALVLWFSDHAGTTTGGEDIAPALFLFCMGMLAWMICGLWWVFAHAEVIDHSVMLRDKQRARRRSQRRD